MKYRKIRISLYFSRDESSMMNPFPYFSEIRLGKDFPFPICTIPTFISLSFLQAKLDRCYVPFGYIETLIERKDLDLNSNIHQFESVSIDLQKLISDVFTPTINSDSI